MNTIIRDEHGHINKRATVIRTAAHILKTNPGHIIKVREIVDCINKQAGQIIIDRYAVVRIIADVLAERNV